MNTLESIGYKGPQGHFRLILRLPRRIRSVDFLATQIASVWNVKAGGADFFPLFEVSAEYLRRLEIQTVGGQCVPSLDSGRGVSGDLCRAAGEPGSTRHFITQGHGHRHHPRREFNNPQRRKRPAVLS